MFNQKVVYQGSLLRATRYVSREEEEGLLGTELHIKIQLTPDNPSPQRQFEPRANSKNLDFPWISFKFVL